MKYKLLFLDTETTGGDLKDRMIQLAFGEHGISPDEIYDELFAAPVPVSIESQAVHHIRPVMLEGKPLFKDSDDYATVKADLENPLTVLIAHNAPFDTGMMEREDVNPVTVIDTLRVVRHMDTKGSFKRHNLQYLRYAMDLDDEITVKVQAHDAKGDIIVLEKLYDRMAKKVAADLGVEVMSDAVVERMIELTNTPVLVKKFMFGKHNGKDIADVATTDKGYLEWLLKQKLQSENLKSEEDWIYTLKHYLGQS